MRNNMFTVHELTQITGLSRRTIHFYDKIGLLKATQVQENGYRLYSLATVETLKWILFLKDLDLSLQEISNILSMPKKEQMLELAQYQVVLDSKIQQLQHTQRNLSRFLSGEDIFELDFVKKSKTVPLKEQFFKEAKIVYGTTDVFKTFESQMLQLTDEKKEVVFAQFETASLQLFKHFAEHIHEDPTSPTVQNLVQTLHDLFLQVMPCDYDLLLCIAEQYQQDQRYKAYFSKLSLEDLPDFIYRAAQFYCTQHKGN